ncbi:MAG: hypothetical protein J6J38_02560 [Lachnospiraceae bacterium]|nr:hypothetical protein [Lachnospiraceae bacterium]
MCEFDIFLSIGCACRPAYYLRECKLRYLSAPLDWMNRYTLEDCLHLFQTGFEDYFVDIYETENSKKDNQAENRVVIDRKNNIRSIHYFPKCLSLECEQIEFRRMMLERASKINEKLENSSRLCLLCNREEKWEELVSFLNKFSECYEHLHIMLVNVRSVASMEPDCIQENKIKVSSKLSISEYFINDEIDIETGRTFDWRGNSKCWYKILEEYRLSV